MINEGNGMDPTRIREPNHYRLTAEGYSFELHQNVTAQWILTFNGRTWTQEQFASFTESGPLGRMVTLDPRDPRQPNVPDRTITVTLLVPAVTLPEGSSSTPCESLCIWSTIAIDSEDGTPEGQLQTYDTERLWGTASWT
jgi:hypothetical protein